MSLVYTTSETGTYTESRARVVMQSVLEDIVVLASANMIVPNTALKWMEDLLYLLNERVLDYFELQFNCNGGRNGYKYVLSEDGSLNENSSSGGIDPYQFPQGTTVALVANLDLTKTNIRKVYDELARRGWGTNGVALHGQATYERAYSKDGYGLKRHKVGL